ncbi:MAG: hypothetical protein Q8Q73_05820 [Stagnimonas sp.]|nr:hypothetical protein [Stagnimonas sp.]
MPDLPRLLPASALLALVTACSGNSEVTGSGDTPLPPAAGPVVDTGDPCPRSAALVTGPDAGPLYRSVAPFEHHDIERSNLFADACALQEMPGGDAPVIVERIAPDNYATPFNAQTRERGELLLHGFGAKAGAPYGGYVAMLDAETLAQRWRTPLYDEEPASQWSWPGMVTAHGNGYLYAVYGNHFYKLDPADGAILAERVLPENAAGAVYNGFDVLPDGRLATKNMESPPLCPATLLSSLLPYNQLGSLAPLLIGVELFGGLACHLLLNTLPSTMLVLDPEQLDVVAELLLPEPVNGRITVREHDGDTYLYIAGKTTLYRYLYRDGAVSLDDGWGPVTYAEPTQGPAAAASFIGDWVILQNTGYARAGSLIAIDIHDASKQWRIEPFELVAGVPVGPSFVLSKPSVDAENRVVVALDTFALQLAAVKFDPDSGFEVLWRRPSLSIAYSALVGTAEQRQIVIPDQLQLGPVTGDAASGAGQDRVLWIDLLSGATVASSGPLSLLPAPGNIVTPGFRGRYYYPGFDGLLHELSLAPPAATAP